MQDALTYKQATVMAYLEQGKSISEIARQMKVSRQMIYKHRAAAEGKISGNPSSFPMSPDSMDKIHPDSIRAIV